METNKKTIITVETSVNIPVHKAWKYWTAPEHIIHWNNASVDWCTPRAENDLRVGGSFISRMEAKDGSFGFDFSGVYNEIEANKLIVYTLGDGRKVRIAFTSSDNTTKIEESFEAETENSIDLQKNGWQAILSNFKKYAENRV
jgi:uncharacterized protein YndB with AHSA1/START domain